MFTDTVVKKITNPVLASIFAKVGPRPDLVVSNLETEAGDNLVQEDGGFILLE